LPVHILVDLDDVVVSFWDAMTVTGYRGVWF
jgi:hypothetical protein